MPVLVGQADAQLVRVADLLLMLGGRSCGREYWFGVPAAGMAIGGCPIAAVPLCPSADNRRNKEACAGITGCADRMPEGQR